MCQTSYILRIFNFGTNMGLAGGKYFIKLALDIKIEFGILELLDEPNFNKFEHFQFWDQFWPNI